jgi:hypothetical protein
LSKSRWRDRSRTVILAALESGRKAGLEGKDLERYVSAAYPFGERAMFPYKVWLNEFSAIVKGQYKPMGRIKVKKGPKLLGTWPGLFDHGEIPIGRAALPGQSSFLEEDR